jgi:hypothetical protein
MSEQKKHLTIERELLSNDRRTDRRRPQITKRDDLRVHGQKLAADLSHVIKCSQEQITSQEGDYVLKLQYSGSLAFKDLSRHGVEFVSQEDKGICIAFSNKDGLTKFTDHLQKLGLDNTDITYKQVLEALEGIENWTAEDRKSWAVKQKGLPSFKVFKLDIELWPVNVCNHPERIELCSAFEKWLTENRIHRIDKINQDSLLMYRVEVSHVQAKKLFNHRDVRLIDLLPQTGISYQQLNVDLDEVPINLAKPADNAARICILDSGINSNHPLLKTSIAESESYITSQDASDNAGHGTAVTGIALYEDVESCAASNSWNPQFWLFSGKILDLDPLTGEACFDEKTIEKTLIEAVGYFAEQHGCRIFNLSIGNENAPYDGRHIRGIAYILDTLARKHNALFVVSAGNFRGSETPQIPLNSWRDEYPDYLRHDVSIIIDPATALNVLTVGSIVRHDATIDEQKHPEINALSPASENQPSPFTRHGPSSKGALKPELMAYGGNLASPMRIEGKQWNKNVRGLGVLTLNHAFIGNTLLKEISGTSFAAPYVTHLAGRLLNEYPTASANLLRALLVNHANLPNECKDTFSEKEKSQYKDNKETKNRELVREIAGYGMVDEDILYRSTENAVVLMAEDSIENNAHYFYELPLPATYLRTNRVTRELRITLAYSPLVSTTRLDYTATRISYRLVKGDSLEKVQLHFNQKTQGDAETLNDSATPNRDISSQLRDKGTVQSSTWSFRQLKPTDKWFVVVTRNDREWGIAMCLEQERYALVITVADRDNQQAQLYTEIRQRIQEKERIRSQIQY